MEDQPLRDATPLLGDAGALRARLDEEGYLYLPRLLPRVDVHALRDDILRALGELGWLAGETEAPPRPSAAAVLEGWTPEYLRMYAAVQRLQHFHALASHGSLLTVLRAILGDDVLVHPRKIARVIIPAPPEAATPPHQDYRQIQGTADVITAWIPLDDVPASLGGLRILAGSQRFGLRRAREVPAGTGGQIADIAAGEMHWVSTEFGAGDALLFHSFTVHAAHPNRTDRLRLSVDYRFQRRSDPILEASLLPHYHPGVPGWEELFGGADRVPAELQSEATLQLALPHQALDPAMTAPPSSLVHVVRGEPTATHRG